MEDGSKEPQYTKLDIVLIIILGTIFLSGILVLIVYP